MKEYKLKEKKMVKLFLLLIALLCFGCSRFDVVYEKYPTIDQGWIMKKIQAIPKTDYYYDYFEWKELNKRDK